MLGEVSIYFQGQVVSIIEKRIPMKDQNPRKFYYGIRHSDHNLGEPATVEPSVDVNFWGTMITEHPLNFGDKGYIQLTPEEQQVILYGKKVRV